MKRQASARRLAWEVENESDEQDFEFSTREYCSYIVCARFFAFIFVVWILLSRENDRAEFAVRQSEKMCEENPCDRLATLRTGFDGFGSGWLKSFCDSLPAVSPEYARDFFVFSVDLDTNFDTGSEFGNIVLNSLYTVRKLDFLTLNPKFYEAVQAIPFSEWDRLEKRVKKVVGESKLNWTETFFSATKEILTIWDVKLIAISVLNPPGGLIDFCDSAIDKGRQKTLQGMLDLFDSMTVVVAVDVPQNKIKKYDFKYEPKKVFANNFKKNRKP